jgi:hypothetical protein
LPFTSRIQWHEALFLALGGVLTLVLAVQHGLTQGATLAVAATTAGYAGVMQLSEKGSRARLLSSAVVTWLLYVGSSGIIEVLRLPLHSGQILAWDIQFFGATPAVAWQSALSRWIVEVLSAAYLSYQVYVHWAFFSAWCLPTAQRLAFMQCVFTTFVVGFSAYFLFPAATPGVAFPDLFAASLDGGTITRFNEMLNARIAARYDAFPSMHVLATVTLLSWDFRNYRARFWMMLLPALLMAVGTLALRLHYFTDLLASAALFVVLQSWFRLRTASQAGIALDGMLECPTSQTVRESNDV